MRIHVSVRSSRRRLQIVAASLALLALPFLGCGGHGHDNGHEGPQADEYVVNCETADGGIAASDEDFQAFVNAEAAGQVVTTPDTALPVLTSPTGSTLSITAAPTFSFSGMMAALPRKPAGTTGASDNTMACRAPARRRSSTLSRFVRAVRADLVLERRAEAHCAPAMGERYLLRLETAGGQALYTVTLSVTSFQPDATIWSRKLQGQQGQTVTLVLERATFAGGTIVNGLYKATPAPTFTVGP
jgi:hypothetical protein